MAALVILYPRSSAPSITISREAWIAGGAEASELGLPPGSWPEQISLTVEGSNMRGEPLARWRVIGSAEELGGFHYRSATGAVFTIWND